jgi:hypothetical protein
MSDDPKSGTDWTDNEIDKCVDAYFDLFSKQLSGTSVVKSHLYKNLAEQIGRSHKSVEWKFQNISAVLDEMGLDWARGLTPASNFQKSLADSIASRLPTFLKKANSLPVLALEEEDGLYLEAAPERATRHSDLPPYMKDLIAKFDPIERDKLNTTLGKAGERMAFHHERTVLNAADRPDLARKVRWVAEEDGDGAGYDILSYEPNGKTKFVEVKTTVGNNRTPFYISRNEFNFSQTETERFRLFRIYDLRKSPRAFELPGNLNNFVRISAESYRADFLA